MTKSSNSSQALGPLAASFNFAEVAQPADGSTLEAQLARLPELDGSGLREEWRRLCRSEPPRMSRDLLTRALAYRLQEREFGGLPKWAKQSLEGSSLDPVEASGAPAPRPTQALLRPGARLVREWHGRTHSVIVLDDAFEFDGKRYASLTQIAREITRAHWSGPRFFGLVKRKAASGMYGEPGSREVREEPAGLEPRVQIRLAAEFRRDGQSSGGEGACVVVRIEQEPAHG